MKFLDRLKSRKLILAVIGSIVAFGNAYWGWGLTTAEMQVILLPLLAFIGMEGLADTAGRLKE
jgi:hypothetical protein